MSLYGDRYCPKCNADLLGPPIPKQSRHHYGGKTHYRRVIGVYSREKDRTVAWQCPDCGHEEDREWR